VTLLLNCCSQPLRGDAQRSSKGNGEPTVPTLFTLDVSENGTGKPEF